MVWDISLTPLRSAAELRAQLTALDAASGANRCSDCRTFLLNSSNSVNNSSQKINGMVFSCACQKPSRAV